MVSGAYSSTRHSPNCLDVEFAMDLSWSIIKETFFAIGSVAGVVALLRPLFDARHKRDIARASRLMNPLPENLVFDLEPSLYQSRQAPDWMFQPFEQLMYELRTNQDGIRFSGPLRGVLSNELRAMLEAYRKLRDRVQVPEWEPCSARGDEDNSAPYWTFNKQAFKDDSGIPKGYVQHLDECVCHARAIARAYQRFQIAADTHLLEVPVSRWLLPRRYKASRLG